MTYLSVILQKRVFMTIVMMTCIGVIIAGCGENNATNGTSTAASCDSLPKLTKKAHYTVGLSQGESNSSAWRKTETISMQEEAAKRGDQIVVTQAQGSEQQQITDVNSLISQKVDAIFIAPLTATPLAQAVLNAHIACIPVFLLDRDVDHTIAIPGKDYVTFMGSDFLSEGKKAADWLIKATNGKAKILEIEGTVGASAATQRKQGFDDEIKTASGMQILDSQSADFSTATARTVFKALLAAYPDVTAVYTHNDGMSYGVIDDLLAAGKKLNTDVLIASIDGESKSIQNVADGKVGVVISCSPRFGQLAFDTMEQYANGTQVPLWVKVTDNTYTRDNAAASVSQGF